MMRVIPIGLIIGRISSQVRLQGRCIGFSTATEAFRTKTASTRTRLNRYVQLRRKKPASHITEILICNFSGPKTAKN